MSQTKIAEKGNKLSSEAKIAAGEALVSENRWYVLYLQPQDGNLVLYHRKRKSLNPAKDILYKEDNNLALWSPRTDKLVKNPNSAHLLMQKDGNLVIEEGSIPRWSIEQYGREYEGGYLILQNDGNLVVYKDGVANWNTKTNSDRHWMDDLDSAQPITNISVSGTHNSGMYSTKHIARNPVLCQNLSIYEQLKQGVRYFNLRPNHIEGKGIYTHHGIGDGPRLDEILIEMKRFFDEGTEEMVFLDISHYKNWNPTVSNSLLFGLLAGTIGDYIVEPDLSGKVPK